MMENITLSNGVNIPLVGMGVFKIDSEDMMKEIIENAIDCGYRLFDTAQMYKNEKSLGNALQAVSINREELFLISKVDNGNQWYEQTIKSFYETLNDLQTDYLDAFLIHWPGQNKERILSTWKALEELYEKGKVRSIGVCNFEVSQLQFLLANCRIPPMINQIEHTPFLHNQELLDYCRKNNIQIMAWGPLLCGNLEDPKLQKIADKYDCSVAKLLLRWNVQQNIIPIPKSKNKGRMQSNIDIFSFSIDEEDMKILNHLNKNQRTSHDPNTFDF